MRSERFRRRGRFSPAPARSSAGISDAAPRSTPDAAKKVGVSVSAASVPYPTYGEPAATNTPAAPSTTTQRASNAAPITASSDPPSNSTQPSPSGQWS